MSRAARKRPAYVWVQIELTTSGPRFVEAYADDGFSREFMASRMRKRQWETRVEQACFIVEASDGLMALLKQARSGRV